MPLMSIGSSSDREVIIDRVMELEGDQPLQGLRCCYGPGGSGSTWEDRVTFWGDPADLTLQGNAEFDPGGEFIILDGHSSTFLDTPAAPDFATNNYAGHVATPGTTLNRNGVTFGIIAKFDEADAAGLKARGAVLWQWHSGPRQIMTMRIQPGTGYLEIWFASDVQGPGGLPGTDDYHTNPRSKIDRFVTIAKDFWPYVLTGEPAVVQISRGTWGWTDIPGRPVRAEHTTVVINGSVYYDGGSGNGIGNFVDCITAWSVGRAQATPITVPVPEPMYANLECDLYGCWLITRFVESFEMLSFVAGFFGGANGSSGLRIGMGIRL